MRKYENQCVNCGLPCLGAACKYKKTPVDYCDVCNCDDAEYRLEGEDFCENCAEKRVKEVFDELTLSEKAEAVNIDLIKIDG